MISIIKAPDHLLSVLDSFKFELVTRYRSGLYIKTQDQLIYLTSSTRLNPLSVSLREEDLRLINQGSNIQYLNFLVDDISEIVDLKLGENKTDSPYLNQLVQKIEEMDFETGLSGKARPFMQDYDLLKNENDIKSLIGKGLGLTPSGDDIILGMNFCLTILGQEKIHLDPQDLARTNRISQEFLIYSLDDIYSEALISLYSREDIGQSLEKILRYGSTSGADTLLGIYSVLKNRL